MYSKDFRKLALKKINEFGITKASSIMNVHRTTLWRWKRALLYKNKLKNVKRVNNLFNKLNQFIATFIKDNPFTPLYKLQKELKQIHKISKATLSKYVKKLGFSRKRTRKRGNCKNNALPLLTSNFLKRVEEFQLQNKQFVCVDECGFSENLRPLYGFSPKGEPLIVKTNGGWVHYSLLFAIFPCGKVNYVIEKGSINKDMFQSFINSLPIDNNHVILLDNASIHKKLNIANNANLIYTPPYSPEFNPIELCFAKIKSCFRNMFVSNTKNVNQSIIDSISMLHPYIISNCYSHVFQTVIPKCLKT
jgi:transposase